MNIKHFVLSVFIILISYNISAQEQLKHKMKWYVDENGKFYTNKHLPVYIRIAHSPEEGAESHLLKSKSMPQYTNPMYFDTEGYNSFRSPSAVDTVSKQTVRPKIDIKFEVYADGRSPKTTIHFSDAKKYVNKHRKVFYGSRLQISLKSRDAVSGVDKIYYSINGSKYVEYKGEIYIEEEGDISLKYYAVDNVGNVENVQQAEFSIDLSPPTTTYNVKGELVNGVISPKAKIVLSAQDAISGVSRIMYSLNNVEPRLYVNPINLSSLKGGEVKLKFFAVDNVGNSESKIHINEDVDENENSKANTTATHNSSANEYVMFLDKTGPNSSAQIIGDKYQGKHLFITENSKIQLDASDDKTQVNTINYSINTKNKDKLYEEPFALSVSRNGLYSINFCATDKFGNVGKANEMRVYFDNMSPISKITVGQKKFVYGNSIIISKNTNIHIDAMDLGSQVNRIEYSVDNSEFLEGSDFNIDTEGEHKVKYKSVDNVGNEEDSKSISVTVDSNAPKIYAVHSMETVGREFKEGKYYPIYPTGTALFLAATDAISGITKFTYSINGKNAVNYLENPLISYDTSFKKEGFYSVKVVVADKLGNQTEKIVEFFTRKS